MKSDRLTVRTMLAKSFETTASLRGHDIFAELLEDSFWSTVCVSLGGRRVTAEESKMLDALGHILPLGDPRIWPLKLTRLIGSYGRSFTGMAGGYTVMDGAIVGPYPSTAAAQFLYDAVQGYSTDDERAAAVRQSLDQAMERGERIASFGVPGRDFDERCVAFFKWHAAHVERPGPYWRAYEVAHTYGSERYRLKPNIVGPVSAVALDIGLAVESVAAFTSFFIHWAFLANALEATRESPKVLRRLPPQSVKWQGAERRRSPRARAASQPNSAHPTKLEP